jgi:hypothetical protein
MIFFLFIKYGYVSLIIFFGIEKLAWVVLDQHSWAVAATVEDEFLEGAVGQYAVFVNIDHKVRSAKESVGFGGL